MKKIIAVLFVLITAILFWSPWMGEDGGEDVIRKISLEANVKAEIEELSDNGKYCDGLSSKWAPFGRTVNYCEYGSWYITFWGQRF